MASTLSQSYRNLPANSTEISAFKKLLDGDYEHRSFILRRRGEVQAQYFYAKTAAEVFADSLVLTKAVKDAYAASILSTKALEGALKTASNLFDDDLGILATISSTKGVLATWTEIVALTEALLTQLDKATPQVETHLRLAADEQAAHESAHIAAAESMRSCTDSLRAVDRSIAQKRRALLGLRSVPTEILSQIFIEAVDTRQREIITSLSSYYDAGTSFYSLDHLLTTLNLVPFTLSATCKRWRAICQSTPRLWRYARAPMSISTIQGSKIVGKAQFERCVLLTQKQPLELTVYTCYDATHRSAIYPKLVLPAESQTLRVNIVWHDNYAIPHGVPSPSELCIVASANANARTPILPTTLLANTKKLRCTGLIPQINYAVGIQSLYISLRTQGVLPHVLRNCPRLKELHLEMNAGASLQHMSEIFTHQHLHTLSLTGIALPWVISAFSAGYRLPRLAHFVLTDINGPDPSWSGWGVSLTNDQFSHITQIEVQGVSTPSAVTHFRPLFEVATALRTLTLTGSAVDPMLGVLTLPTTKRVEKLIMCDSNANGETLQDYLTAIVMDGGSTAGMEVAWENCPNFSGEYGRAFGELHL